MLVSHPRHHCLFGSNPLMFRSHALKSGFNLTKNWDSFPNRLHNLGPLNSKKELTRSSSQLDTPSCPLLPEELVSNKDAFSIAFFGTQCCRTSTLTMKLE